MKMKLTVRVQLLYSPSHCADGGQTDTKMSFGISISLQTSEALLHRSAITTTILYLSSLHDLKQ